MNGLPQTTVVGTLTGDPEIKMLPNGSAVTTVNIACNERRYNKDTKQYEDGDTTFLRGTVWRQYGENVADSLVKGDRVVVVGRLRQRSWEKDGQRRSTFELDIEEIGPSLRFATATVSRSGGRAPVAAGWGSSSGDEPAW